MGSCTRLLLTLAVAARSFVLHDVCPNSSFQLSLVPNSVLREHPHLQHPVSPSRESQREFVRLVHGRKAVEIGGPSLWLHGLYEMLPSLLNIVHSTQHPLFAVGDQQQLRSTYGVWKSVCNETMPGDGASLAGIGNGTFDLLIASHVLEHMRDPFGALREWDRVLNVGGRLLLVLPWANATYDRFRTPHTMQQILQRHSNPEIGSAEIEQIVRTTDFDRINTAMGKQAHKKISLQMLRDSAREDTGLMHWHVFDFDLLVQLLHCLRYKIEFLELWRPWHQVVIASKLPSQSACVDGDAGMGD